MAKKKMTLEEKLEEAIVKDNPYEVPENWVWSKLSGIAGEFQYGYTAKASIDDTGVKYIRITDLSNGMINFSSAPYCKINDNDYEKYKLIENDILIARMGSVGENGMVINDDQVGVFASYLIRIKPWIDSKYLMYILQSSLYWNQIYNNKKGTTRANINANTLRELVIPIPPLKEQQRIVDKIESLFEKLDRATELIEEARDDFEKRKSAILERAIMGKYIPGVKLTKVELGNILSFKNGMSKRSGKEGKETKVLRLADVSNDDIYSESARSMLLTEKEITNYKVEDGDLLIIRVNGTKKNVGKAIEYVGKDVCTYCDHLIRIDCSETNRSYIKYLINSDNVRRQIDELIVSSAGQNTISQSSLNKIKTMWVEDNKIQEKIVGVINNFINREKSIDVLTKLEEIELMKKSILAKAFRGQLGTNCEEDESALELLKEVLSKE